MIKITTLRSELGVLKGRANEDLLPRLRNAVIALWESRTSRQWSLRTGRTKEFRIIHPLSDRTLHLDLYPVAAITSVEERFAPQKSIGSWTRGIDEDYEVVDTDQYFVREDIGTIERFNDNWKGLVKVTWDGGYADDTAPGDILEALILQAQFMVARWDPSKIAITSQGFESGSTSFITGDTHPQFKKLARYYMKRTI